MDEHERTHPRDATTRVDWGRLDGRAWRGLAGAALACAVVQVAVAVVLVRSSGPVPVLLGCVSVLGAVAWLAADHPTTRIGPWLAIVGFAASVVPLLLFGEVLGTSGTLAAPAAWPGVAGLAAAGAGAWRHERRGGATTHEATESLVIGLVVAAALSCLLCTAVLYLAMVWACATGSNRCPH